MDSGAFDLAAMALHQKWLKGQGSFDSFDSSEAIEVIESVEFTESTEVDFAMADSTATIEVEDWVGDFKAIQSVFGFVGIVVSDWNSGARITAAVELMTAKRIAIAGYFGIEFVRSLKQVVEAKLSTLDSVTSTT